MKSNAREDLRQQIPGLPPATLAAIPEDAAGDLATLLLESRRQQRQALDAAIEKSLRHVPLLLRGPLKRILFP